MPLHIPGDANTGDAADVSRDFLNDDHQRKAENECPGEAVAELGTDLAMGADAAGIVVRRAGDQAWAERLEERAHSARIGFWSAHRCHCRLLTAVRDEGNCGSSSLKVSGGCVR